MDKFIKILSLGLIEREHLDFNGTINGWSYFARGFRGIPGAIVWGLLSLIFIGIPMYLALMVVIFILGISSSIKRIRAMFPFRNSDPVGVYVAFFSMNLVGSLIGLYGGGGVVSAFGWIIYSISVIFNLYLLFGNSNQKHNG